MNKARLAAQSRSQLDERFRELGPAKRYTPPVRGWIKALREALGMSTAQLAKRLGIRQPSLVALEQSEAKGTIELATLRRVAEALDCTLVYALVPKKPLETTLRDRARAFARRRRAPVEHSMLLEDQKVTDKDAEARLDEIVREINPRLFWDYRVSDLFEQPENATPLTPEEMRELIPAHIAYRSELNEAEQENIARAQDWALDRRRDPLSEKFVKDLHRQMLGDVWRWAGKFRMSERNLGIAFYEIPVALRQLLDDTRAWIEYKTYPPDEIAVRFHHRLVQIHPFPNGNGRHARLMADLLVMSLGGERFSWGSANLQDARGVRQRYIAALHAADDHDIGPLLAFSRS